MKRQTFNDINITPLTDIFLVLLILMMVIAPILDQQGISLAVPEFVEENQQNKDSKILTIQITSDDRYIIEDNQIEENNLLNVLKEQIETHPDGMMIEASGESSHDKVVKLMDKARVAGIKSISIVEM